MLTKASAVAKPIPLILTPVTRMVLPCTCEGKACATSKASVDPLKLGLEVEGIIVRRDENYARVREQTWASRLTSESGESRAMDRTQNICLYWTTWTWILGEL